MKGAQAKSDWKTYYQTEDPARVNANLLRDALARANASAAAPV
jgi:hypothetical protein